MWTAEDLIAFEKGIADEFNAGHIRAPVHLDGGNEEQLIEIFKDIKPNDWVCGSWRMHYKCLLKGVPVDKLNAAIFQGRSITLCFPEYRVISSAIVGGVLPLAVGLALGIKRRGGSELVWCFAGDMTFRTGMFDECVRYASGHSLPIRFVVEDNGLSVCTPTEKVWGIDPDTWVSSYIQAYRYKLPWPHAGAGKRVQF